jgi:hypothetical protein
MDFLDEVAQDVQREKWINLWKKNRTYIFTVILAIILGSAAGILWRDYQKNRRMEESRVLAQALDKVRSNDLDGATDILKGLEEDSGRTYKMLSKFTRAGLALQQNKPDEAMALYLEIAEKDGVDRKYRALAAIRAGYVALQQDKMDDTLRDRIRKIADSKDDWRFSALELEGMDLILQGKTEEAGKVFETLKQESKIPENIKTRAEVLANRLREEKKE